MSGHKHGCCVDREYGKGCTEDTCMELPPPNVCDDCAHVERCCTTFGAKPGNTHCQFFPRRFRERSKGGEE